MTLYGPNGKPIKPHVDDSPEWSLARELESRMRDAAASLGSRVTAELFEQSERTRAANFRQVNGLPTGDPLQGLKDLL